MNMKKKNLMLLAALTVFATACTNNEDPGENPANGLISEVQLELSGKGEGVEYTRAIASDNENKIDNLSIYVFASNTADGTYYYRETWTSAAADDKVSKTFTLQDAGTKKKASIFPTDAENLSYLKLFLVANPADNLYQEDGTTALTLTAATAYDGTNPTPTGATTETAFRASFSKLLGDAENITPSLMMTGQGKTKIVGTVSKLDIDLLRTVARFDIDNTATTSNLTIQTIAIIHGRKTAPLWNATPTKVDELNLATSPLLMTYNEVDYTALPNANRGVTESAVYTNPSLATDQCALLIKGTYKSGSTGTELPAEYTVPFQKTDDGGLTASPIAIERNNRYTLRILDVTTTSIKATFDIEDWITGGGINVKPENEAPSFTAESLFGDTPDGDKPVALVTGDITQYRVAASKTFKIVMAATGPTAVEKSIAAGPATKATAGDPGWLTVAALTDPDYEVKDGITYTTFTVTTDADLANAYPVSLRFINETASPNPELQPVLTFFAPAEAPAMTDATGHNMGNTVDATDPLAVTATMQKAVGSMIRVKVNNFEGLIAEAPTGMTAREVARDGLASIYELEIYDAATIGNDPVTVTLKNAADETLTSTVTITLEQAEVNTVTASVQSSFNQGINPAPIVQPDGSVTANMYAGTAGATGKCQIQVRMTSPNGVAREFVNDNPTKVTVTKGSNNIYTIATTDQAVTGNTYTIGFKSAVDPNSVTNVVITMVEATVTVEAVEGLTVAGQEITLASLDPGSRASGKIMAPVGSRIAVSGSIWLSWECPEATTRNADGNYAKFKTSIGGVTPNAPVTLTVTNAATGEEKVFTIKHEP